MMSTRSTTQPATGRPRRNQSKEVSEEANLTWEKKAPDEQARYIKHVRQTATDLVNRGMMPLPLIFGTKMPACKWASLTLPDVDIEKMFPTTLRRNIGVVLGDRSGGLIDVDLDCPEAIAAGAILLPKTGRVSGRPGARESHYWYTVEQPPRSVKHIDPVPGEGRRGTLIELRSSGSMSVLPPSIHKSGEQLVWHQEGKPAVVTAAELVDAVARVAAASLLARYWPGEGSRQDAFLALAGALCRLGWEEEETEAFVDAICQATGDEEDDLRPGTVYSTYRNADGDAKITGWPRLEELLGQHGSVVISKVRRLLPQRRAVLTPAEVSLEYQPFPTHLLPTVLRNFTERGAASVGCDPAYFALPALSLIGTAIGTSHAAVVKRGEQYMPFVWSVCVGDSGNKKTPAFKRVMKAASAINAQLSKLKNGGGRVFKLSDITLEAVHVKLQDNPRGVLIARDEMQTFFNSFTRYRKGGDGGDMHNWLEMFEPTDLESDRKNKDIPSVRAKGVAVSVTGTTQPEVMRRAMKPECWESGLVARFLIAMPPRRYIPYREEELSDDVETAFIDLATRLYNLATAGTGESSTPHLVQLSQEAKQVYVAFHDRFQWAIFTADSKEASCRSKLIGYSVKLALILHLCRHVDRAAVEPIGKDDMEAAVGLCDWFFNEAWRVYSLFNSSGRERQATETFQRVRTLASKNGGGITARDLQSASGSKYPTGEAARLALQSLVDSNLGRWDEQPPPPTGGHTTKRFVPFEDAPVRSSTV